MTLSGLIELALRQLDEQPEDVSEYDGLFRCYANMGYMIAQRLFLRPRETFAATTDGRADVRALPIVRVIDVQDTQGRALPFAVSADGAHVQTGAVNAPVALLCEVELPLMERDTDEPRLPACAQPALADYICYRHLSSGSLAKQSRAQFFYQSFIQQMRALRPQGAGSVTRMQHLYETT